MNIPEFLVKTFGNSRICFTTPISFSKVSFHSFQKCNRYLFANRVFSNNTVRCKFNKTLYIRFDATYIAH